jgi:hypothetical protein
MRNSLSRTLVLGVTAITALAATGAHGAVLLNSGFEALTGVEPTHFAGGKLIDGHASSTANPLASPLIYVTPDPAPLWVADTEAGGTMNPTEGFMPGGALEGEQTGWSSGALLYQTLADDIQPSTRYTFTINIGRPTVSATDFAYRIILNELGLVRAQDYNSVPVAVGEWEPVTLTWDSPAVVTPGSKLTVNFAADAGVVLFDDIEVSSGPSIPEPAMGMLALAHLAAGLIRRRR